jgi:hypothetical protein
MKGKLDLSADGKHHVLDGRNVEIGDSLELKLSGGRWLRCRYRWNGDPETQPVFSIVLGGVWERRLLRGSDALEAAPEAILRMEMEDAEFRWPAAN